MNLLRQPLVQFLVIGALVFAADWYVNGRQDDPRRILIDDARYAEIAGIFLDNRGREPSDAEMNDLVVTWAQNEVLYREARLMGLDDGDEMIRQRLILKLRNVLFNRLVADAPDEDALRAWFETNRARYDIPESFDFEQFRVGGEDARVAAEALAAELGTGAAGPAWQDAVREYARRPAGNLAVIFGEDDTARLTAAAVGEWVAVSSPAGWHLARVTQRLEGRAADFDAIRGQVGEDWKAATQEQQLARVLRDIADDYDIRIELSAPPADWDGERFEQARLAMGSAE
jgi:hypothetical protein